MLYPGPQGAALYKKWHGNLMGQRSNRAVSFLPFQDLGKMFDNSFPPSPFSSCFLLLFKTFFMWKLAQGSNDLRVQWNMGSNDMPQSKALAAHRTSVFHLTWRTRHSVHYPKTKVTGKKVTHTPKLGFEPAASWPWGFSPSGHVISKVMVHSYWELKCIYSQYHDYFPHKNWFKTTS